MQKHVFITDPKKLRAAANNIPDIEGNPKARFVSQVLVFSHAGNLLTLLKKRERSGPAWDLPGGGVEPGESFLQAAHRELGEELKLNPPKNYIPFSLRHENITSAAGLTDYIAMTFLTTMREEISPMVDCEEHIAHQWSSWRHSLDLTDKTRRFQAFSEEDLVRQQTVQNIAALAKTLKPLSVSRTISAMPPHPSQLPSLEG